MSIPTPRSSQRTGRSTGAGGGFGKLVFAVIAVLIIGFGVWGYQRAHTPEFKLECAAYQAHIISMSFPDNFLCLTFWNLS